MRCLGVVGTSRASFSVFNSPDDVERLAQAVAGLDTAL
jgi:selenocysteine lyase/cysteine desulfurase